MHLMLYEARRADLLYCLLLQKERGAKASWRKAVLRLVTALLRTNRVSARHKARNSAGGQDI